MASAFPNSLRPAARSAYRAVLRSARITFHGDPQRHLALTTALRQTFSSPTLTTPGSPSSSRQPDPPTSCSGSLSSTTTTPSSASSSALQAEESTLDPSSPEELSKRIEEWKEIALFLRRNVVQGELKGDGSYRLRVTPDTELGDNTTIRDPPKLPTTPFPNRNRSRRRRSQPVEAVSKENAVSATTT